MAAAMAVAAIPAGASGGLFGSPVKTAAGKPLTAPGQGPAQSLTAALTGVAPQLPEGAAGNAAGAAGRTRGTPAGTKKTAHGTPADCGADGLVPDVRDVAEVLKADMAKDATSGLAGAGQRGRAARCRPSAWGAPAEADATPGRPSRRTAAETGRDRPRTRPAPKPNQLADGLPGGLSGLPGVATVPGLPTG